MRSGLIKKREAKKLTRAQMAKKCQCSERLIVGIEEDDWITLPTLQAGWRQDTDSGCAPLISWCMRAAGQRSCRSRRRRRT